jgi:hypothetical protein
MAYLKSSQITGLSAKDVDVKGFTQAGTLKLGDRAYTEHEVLLADAYNIVGDVTVSEDLILSKLSDDGDAITLTGDTTTRTITGSGSIQGATLAQTPNATLTGMTGELGSAVTGGAGLTALGTVASGTLGSGVTFPAGHVINTYQINQAGGLSANSSTATIIPGLTKTLTPVSSTSKFLFIVTASGHLDSGTDTAHEIDLFYGGVSLGPKLAVLSSVYGITYNNLSNSLSFTFLHAPATTSSITYDVRGRVYYGSGNMYWYPGGGHMTILELTS